MPDERVQRWKFALGALVSHANFPKSAFIVVWREYRETIWNTRQRYGLMGIEDQSLDLRNDTLRLEQGSEDDLTLCADDPDACIVEH